MGFYLKENDMKNFANTTRKLGYVLMTAAALVIVGCGSGSDGGDSLPVGKVGTVGDGVNTAEYEAIQGGMNREQIIAIIGDQPTKDYGTALEWRQSDPYVVVFFNELGLVREKDLVKTGVSNPINKVIY